MYRICTQGAVLTLAALCLIFVGPAGSAAADEFPPIFEPVLSLTGDCSTPAPDTVPDPSCPYLGPPSGPTGRFEEARGIGIDLHGNIYVANGGAINGRIDIFSAEGFFISELKTAARPQSVAIDSKGNLYVFENQKGIFRYAPSTYKPESGEIAYATPGVQISANPFSGGLAIDVSNDHLYAAEETQLTEYDAAAEGNKVLKTLTHPKLGDWSTWSAVDAQRRRLYASYCKNSFKECGVLVFEAGPPYGLLKEIDGSSTPAKKFFSSKGWLSIAVDETTGHFYVEDLEATKNIFEFDQNFDFVSKLTMQSFQGGNALQIAVANTPAAPSARDHRYLFVPGVALTGRTFAFEPQTETTIGITDPTAVNIGETEAELKATIDPSGGNTDWTIEYVSQEDYEASEWANAQLAGEGTTPGALQQGPASALISGLEPDTAYRFKVFGENGFGGHEEVGTFTTYSDAPTATGPCPNAALRIGPSAILPDCRAYELVTPGDTGGRPPKGVDVVGGLFSTVESSLSGGAVSFSLPGGALPGTEGNGGYYGDQYRSTRSQSGWTTIGLGPSGAAASASHPGSTSPDQGFAFWSAVEVGSAVIGGIITRYVRYPNTRLELIGRGTVGTDLRAEGKLITENGSHIVFQTVNTTGIIAQQLEPNAPPTGTTAVYDRTPDEITHVVSLLPGDVTPVADEDAVYLGSSPDGEGIAFEIGGTFYLRLDNMTTFEIGDGIEFAGVSENGKRFFYVEGGDLLAFDTETEEVIEFSETGDATVVNVATGGDRAYFASPSVLGGENPNGATAQAGEQNLYLSEEGQISFVGTVTDRDVEGETTPNGGKNDGLGLWVMFANRAQPSRDPSRLNPDGTVMLFQSRANLDGYDPAGAPQIYRFDSLASRLHCISCIPTKVPGIGGASLQSAAAIASDPEPFSAFGFVPGLTPDGSRAFFESTEALVSGDTDDVQDVYEWEEEGVGRCAREGGCVYLITSGHSQRDNYLYAHSESGDDVFFVTGDRLTSSDGSGALSIYDARVAGGFAEPKAAICEGEGCHPSLSAPPRFAARTTTPLGNSGNVRKGKLCPKGKKKVKRNGKFVCVRKKPNKQKNKGKKASKSGRAGK